MKSSNFRANGSSPTQSSGKTSPMAGLATATSISPAAPGTRSKSPSTTSSVISCPVHSRLMPSPGLKARGKNYLLRHRARDYAAADTKRLLIPQYILFRIGWAGTGHSPAPDGAALVRLALLHLPAAAILHDSIPEELVDAAKIDGAGHLSASSCKSSSRFPSPPSPPSPSSPSLATGTISSVRSFTCAHQKSRPLPVCLVQYQGAYGNTDWNLMMAVATIAVIPVMHHLHLRAALLRRRHRHLRRQTLILVRA